MRLIVHVFKWLEGNRKTLLIITETVSDQRNLLRDTQPFLLILFVKQLIIH